MRVIHTNDETSNQIFFVNTALLRKSDEHFYIPGDDKAEDGMRPRSDGWVDCVSLETPPVPVSIGTPSPLRINEAQAPPCR
jgi:hypothetical protein